MRSRREIKLRFREKLEKNTRGRKKDKREGEEEEEEKGEKEERGMTEEAKEFEGGLRRSIYTVAQGLFRGQLFPAN